MSTHLSREFIERQRQKLKRRQEAYRQSISAPLLHWLPEFVEFKADEALPEILKALLAIRLGEYGICEGCGEEIPEARLRIRISATRCVACQTAEEIR